MIKVGQTHVLLEDPSGQLDAIIERYHSLDLMATMSDPPAVYVQRGTNLIYPNYPALPCPRVNQIVIPSGATRWGYALFLATESQKNAILAESQAATDRKLKIEFSTLDSFRPGTVKPLKIWMHPLQPRPLSTRLPTGVAYPSGTAAEALWLMPFVDRRYWWQYKSVGKMSGESFETMADVVAFLRTKLDVSIQLTCLNFDYEAVLPAFRTGNDNENAAVVLESLAWHIGCQLVPEVASTVPNGQEETYGREFALLSVDESPFVYTNNLAGKVGVRPCLPNRTAGPTTPNNGWENVGPPAVLMGGEYHDTGAQLPESVLIKGKTTYIEKKAATIGLATLKTMPKMSATIRVAYAGLSNVADALATRIARDYYNRFAKLYDWSFAGVQPWQLSAFDDAVIYSQNRYAQESDFSGFQVQTRVRGWVANLLTESPESGVAASSSTPTGTAAEFSCGQCTSCLDADGDGVHSDCASADPSPNSWFLWDDASACCDNTADSNVELLHDSACLWASEERECKEKFIEESWLNEADPEIDEAIFHNWTLDVVGDFVVLTHRFYRKV